jgi:hypothetical protein
MNKVKNTFIAFAIFALAGCAALPVPKPLDPQSSFIGISVKTRAPVKIAVDKPAQVFFIKVDREEDLYAQGSFIRSSYAEGGQVYLLNVKPGRYAAVACYKKKRVGMVTEYTTFFPKELIKFSEVTVAPATIAFMGEYVVDQSVGLEGADDAQVHYARLISPGAFTGTEKMVLLPVLTGHGDYYYKGSLHEEKRDKQVEIKFLTNALEDFKGTEWTNIIQKRLGELKAEK